MSAHLATRPSWDCDTCGQPWPCDAARMRLRTETDPADLAVYAGTQLAHACADLPGLDPQAAYERFLGWTRAGLRAREQSVRVLPAEEVTHVSVSHQIRSLLAEALPLDRTLRWVATDLNDVYHLAEAFAEVHARYLPAAAQVFVTVDQNAVTGFVAGTHPLQPPRPGLMAAYEQDMVRAAGAYANRYVVASRTHDARRPVVPHFHLSHLVVHRDYQNRGLATALLNTLHAQLDLLGIACFTSAASDPFVPVLVRHGYNLNGSRRVWDDALTVVGMWREAAAFVPAPGD